MIRMPGRSFEGPLPPLSAAQEALARGLKSDVVALAETIGPRDAASPSRMEATLRHLQERFRSIGLEAELQPCSGPVPAANVVAEVKGKAAPSDLVIVGAHYDTVPGCPGANDNASGVAALLALAKRVPSLKPDRSVRFVAFACEEPPYFQTGAMGSRAHAARCRERGESVLAMISLETMGYYSDREGSQAYPAPLGWFYPSTGNFIAFVGNVASRALVRRCIGTFRKHASFPSEGAALPAFLPGVGWSDQWSFWEEGIPALMVTDTAPFRYPQYHTAEDTPEKIDYGRFARVVEGLVPVIVELAGTSAPSSSGSGP
jgi:Zn-dependent M28 family amino/carboxypeptidase